MRAVHVDMADFRVLEVSRNSCNISTHALPDMYALTLGRQRALGHRVHISGNPAAAPACIIQLWLE